MSDRATPDRQVHTPHPRAHLAGTLRAIAHTLGLVGGALPADVRALLDRPADLPPTVPPEAAALKYDLYLTAASTRAWGLTVNDTWEPAAFRAALDRFLGPRAAPIARLSAALGHVPATTCGLGFDAPGRPPRVKVYLKEARWGAGLTDTPTLRTLAAAQLGIDVPPWLGDRTLGVVAVELHPDGATGLKLYPGGDTAAAAAAGAPGAAPLVHTLARTSPGPGHYYLTVRLGPDAPPRVAMNKVYNVVQTAFTGRGADVEGVWSEVGRLFESAGQGGVLQSLRDRLTIPGLRVVPTATAVEDEGRSVDVYVAAWATEPGSDPRP